MSVTSQRYDRRTKGALYAESGVPEYWLVDVPARVVSVMRVPVDGQYTEVIERRPGDSIELLAFSDVAVPVSEILR